MLGEAVAHVVDAAVLEELLAVLGGKRFKAQGSRSRVSGLSFRQRFGTQGFFVSL